MNAMEISLSGLNVEWQRLQVISQNIANLGTTRTANGAPYSPKRLVSGPVENFERVLKHQVRNDMRNPKSVMVYDIATVNSAARRVYDPAHPHADASGYVSYPAISQADEMTLMVKTSRAYEANLVAMAAAQQMYSSALQIGRQS